MTMTKTLLTSALAATAAVATAAAAPSPRPDEFGDATISRADAQAKASQEFDRLDTDHDGTLSGDELAAMFPDGPMRAMSGMMARMADANGDGKIDRAEFVAAALHRFDRADANHDGQLTKAERDAERDAHRARMHDRMGGPGGMTGGGMGSGGMRDGGMGGGDRPMGRDDGTPMPPPPDDDSQ